MPSTTPCVQCGVVGSVRWERVLTGTMIFVEYYCGRCEHVWRVDDDERLSTPGGTRIEKPERSRASAFPDSPDQRSTTADRLHALRLERWR